MTKLKLFVIILIIGISCNSQKLPKTNYVLLKLTKHQYGWYYVVITSNQKPTKEGKYYVFNSDGVCIIDSKSIDDSTRMKVLDNQENDATLRCKQLMKSFQGKDRTIEYEFYCVDSNQTNWSDYDIMAIQKDSALKYIKNKEYLQNKGYFY